MQNKVTMLLSAVFFVLVDFQELVPAVPTLESNGAKTVGQPADACEENELRQAELRQERERQEKEKEEQLEKARKEREEQERVLEAEKAKDSIQVEQQASAEAPQAPQQKEKKKKEKLPKSSVRPKRSLPGLPTSVKLELVEEEAPASNSVSGVAKASNEEPARDPRKRPERVDDDDEPRVQVLVDPYLETVPDTLSVEVLSQPVAKALATQPIAKRRTRPATKKAIVKVPPPVPAFSAPPYMAQTPGLAPITPQTPPPPPAAPALSQYERDKKLQEIKQLLEQETSQLSLNPPPITLTPLTPSTPLTPGTPMTPITPATPTTPMTPTTPANGASSAPAKDDAGWGCMQLLMCLSQFCVMIRITINGVIKG